MKLARAAPVHVLLGGNLPYNGGIASKPRIFPHLHPFYKRTRYLGLFLCFLCCVSCLFRRTLLRVPRVEPSPSGFSSMRRCAIEYRLCSRHSCANQPPVEFFAVGVLDRQLRYQFSMHLL